MPQKKQKTKRYRGGKPRKKRRRRLRWRNFFVKRGRLRLANILLVVVVLSLVSLQTIRWVSNTSRRNVVQLDYSGADPRISSQEKQAFISRLIPIAEQEQQKYHLLASITIAQAALESDWGQSQLASKYNNLFGIKDDSASAKTMTTKEYVNGRWIVVEAPFATYKNWDASVQAHTQFLAQGKSWDPKRYQSVFEAQNYRQAARALQKKGYATDPNYAAKLINFIQTYHLNQYDNKE